MCNTTLTRRTLLGAALTLRAWDPALAQSPGGTLRIGLNVAAIPLSNGCPIKAARDSAMGITLYSFLFAWTSRVATADTA
ncbi:hypothetical protein JMJ56_29560 [Belnapia sp. T18]|uniref:Uncharacterized protein n=1 Tax=Belnapia arida TaxID=2804533 RepID=A0ABS1UBQ7_9PROT|nr:hypothetical protein [Belnapia arida]MBL6082128.1 hypothetical protein [Belnapia arida]